MHLECFSYYEGEKSTADVDKPVNGKGKQQLWQRLSNAIVDDCELLENASPGKLLKIAQDWVHSQQGVKVHHNPLYCFITVVDDEMIDHLLQLPMPAAWESSVPMVYSVKVFDSRFGLSDEYFGAYVGPEPDDDEDDCEEEEDDGFEGWFWASARKLTWLWFLDDISQEELFCSDDSWDGKLRLVHAKSAIDMMLPIHRF